MHIEAVQAYIKQWLGCITALAVLAMLTDLVLPGNAVKRYVQYGTGVLFLTQLLDPVVRLVQWARQAGWW